MSYASGRANFASDEPDGAFWLYARDDGRVNACSTNASAVVLGARAALGLAPLAAWDSSVLAALRTKAGDLASEVPAWAAVRDQLARSGDAVSRIAVVMAIYLAFYAPYGMRFDAIALPEGADLPRLGAPLGAEPQPVVCWDPARDADPSRADADRDAAVRETQLGVRVHPGEPLPAHGIPGESPFDGPSDSKVAVVLVLAALAAAYLYATAPDHR